LYHKMTDTQQQTRGSVGWACVTRL